MKHLKTYKNRKETLAKFNVGDKVVCIKNGVSKYLVKNKTYTISKIVRPNFCYLEEIPGYDWIISRFILESEYNAKKYNI